MNLQSKVARAFDPSAIGRGNDYARRGRVRIVRHTSREVVARVRGSREYTVELLLRGHMLQVSCTCPYIVFHDFTVEKLSDDVQVVDKTMFPLKPSTPKGDAEAG